MVREINEFRAISFGFIERILTKMIIRDYEKELMKNNVYFAHKQLRMYAPPVILIIGTIGNIISFVVLRRFSSKISTYVFLSALAVMDLLFLYIGLLRQWIYEITDMDVKLHSDFFCKFVVFMGYVCSDSSVWLIVAVTTERFVAVRFPLRASWICSFKITRLMVWIPILIICFVNLHFFWTIELVTFQNTTMCAAVFEHEEIVNDAWPWVDAVIYSIIPMFIILTLNILIIKRVLIATKKRNCLLQGESSHNTELRSQRVIEASRKLTIMLLTVSFCFLITTLPRNITLIVFAVLPNQSNDESSIAKYALIESITEMLMYINHSINFILYCAAGKKFRKQLYHVMQCRRPQRNLYNSVLRNASNQMLLTTFREPNTVTHHFKFV